MKKPIEPRLFTSVNKDGSVCWVYNSDPEVTDDRVSQLIYELNYGKNWMNNRELFEYSRREGSYCENWGLAGPLILAYSMNLNLKPLEIHLNATASTVLRDEFGVPARSIIVNSVNPLRAAMDVVLVVNNLMYTTKIIHKDIPYED